MEQGPEVERENLINGEVVFRVILGPLKASYDRETAIQVARDILDSPPVPDTLVLPADHAEEIHLERNQAIWVAEALLGMAGVRR